MISPCLLVKAPFLLVKSPGLSSYILGFQIQVSTGDYDYTHLQLHWQWCRLTKIQDDLHSFPAPGGDFRPTSTVPAKKKSLESQLKNGNVKPTWHTSKQSILEQNYICL